MEKMKGFDKRALISELLQGMRYANELRNQFSNQTFSYSTRSSSPSSSSNIIDPNQAFNYSLLEKILSSFEKAIIIATSITNPYDLGQQPSSHSCRISSKSGNPRTDFRPPKSRKIMMRKWTNTVQISYGGVTSGSERTLGDRFTWRKYGQKDIVGARFPRGYYKCIHRHTKGCVATKQVQRSDEDPSTYQILYRGEHTCVKLGLPAQAQFNPTNQAQMKSEPHPLPSPKDQEIFVGQGPERELKVEPQQQAENEAQFLRSSSFNPAYLDPEPIDNYMLSITPAFGSPTTSLSTHLPVSPCQPTGPHVGLTGQASETDNNDPVSGPNPFTNSPITSDFEFPIDEFQDIGSYFPINEFP